MDSGDLSGQESAQEPAPAGVRAAVVVQASRGKTEAGKTGTADRSRVMTGGVKGGRKADLQGSRPSEEPIPGVPATDKQGEEDLWQRYGAERGVWSEKMLGALEGGMRENAWFSLIDKVYAERTLQLAWAKVRRNAGGCGVDGITVRRFGKDSQIRLLGVKEHLKQGDYRPKPVKRVLIDKPGGGKRPLGIPTVRDRVVQAALKMVIEPIFEREFAPQSYGFRPGRDCKSALRRVEELLKGGLTHVVDVDIKGYFDCIPHDKLMAKVRERIADGRVLGLIEAFLKQDVMVQTGREASEMEEATHEGTPQGGVISPLLANIYLNPLDWLMRDHGFEMVRYADDMVVLCESEDKAREAMQLLRQWMERMELELHPEKTKVTDMGQPKGHFDFLGYRFWRGKNDGRLKRLIRPKSKQKFRASIRPLTKRCNGHSMEAIAARLEPILRGFYNYFKHAHPWALQELDGWVRGRLRSIHRKRKRRKGRARGKDHQRYPDRYFHDLGLLSLEQARLIETTSLLRGATC